MDNYYGLTQEELKSILNYCPLTGVFTWKDTRHNAVKVGSVAGSPNEKGYVGIKINPTNTKEALMAQEYIVSGDYALLTGLGFRAHYSESILWQDDKEGNHWQAQLGDSSRTPVRFISHYPDFRRRPEQLLTRENFVSLFVEKKAANG